MWYVQNFAHMASDGREYVSKNLLNRCNYRRWLPSKQQTSYCLSHLGYKGS